jgi:hypothetical protein
MQVFTANIVVCADDAAFDQSEGTLDGVGVNIAFGVLA